MIVPTGKGKFKVKSESGKNLSGPLSKSGAQKRLKQVEYFKYRSNHPRSFGEAFS